LAGAALPAKEPHRRATEIDSKKGNLVMG